MKRNLIKRIATAVALAGIAAAVSACGSSSTAAGAVGIGGYGNAISNGQGCTSLSQAIAFTGVAVEDQYGDIDAGPNVGPLTLQATSATSPGGYQFGRVNTTDGSTLEFNLSSTGYSGYGQQISIQGVYIMGQDVMNILGMSSMGAGYTGYSTGYPYGTGSPYGATGGCGVSSLQFSLGADPAAQDANIVGNQPFQYILTSSATQTYPVLVNGQPVPY